MTGKCLITWKKATEALDANDMVTFDVLAKRLDIKDVNVALEEAARCEDFDWQLPFRERGFLSPQPYLPGYRALANYLRVSAMREVEGGSVDYAGDSAAWI